MNLNPGSFFFHSKAFSWIVFSILLILSNLHIVDKSDFKFCTNPGLSQPSFKQPGPELTALYSQQYGTTPNHYVYLQKNQNFPVLELIIQKKMCLLQRHLKFICDVALQESVFHF